MDNKAQTSRLRRFVTRYFARGAVGVSVGLASVAAVSAEPTLNVPLGKEQGFKSFSERLAAVRTAVSEQLNDTMTTAQVVTSRPPPPPPFRNFFGKAPFQEFVQKRPAAAAAYLG